MGLLFSKTKKQREQRLEKKNRTVNLRTVEKNYKGCRVCEIEIAEREK